MEDKKQKIKQILSWISIVLLLWALLFILVSNYFTVSKKEAVAKAKEKMESDVYTWSAQVNAVMETGSVEGKLLQQGGLNSSANLDLAKRMVESTPVEHIYQVKDGYAYINEAGSMTAEALSIQITGAGYCFEDNFTIGNNEELRADSLLVIIPVEDSEEYLVLQIKEAYIESNYFEDSHREVSFLSVADRQGNICITFDSFRDRTSSFFTNLNFLDNISGYNSTEDAGRFKSCYISGVPSSVIAEFKNEKRVLVTSPIGKTGYSLVYGVRNSYAESLISGYYVNSKDTMIRIMFVVAIFSVFVVGVFLYTALRNKERDKVLENKADTDLLTELNNKLATERKIQEYMSTKPDGRGLMFILDIDNFKKINDTMGHAFGDTLLRTLGKEIKAEFRASDIIGRTGGDEFIVFLKDINDDTIIEREANRLLRFFQDFKAGGDYVKYSATASIGAAIFPDNASNFKDLYVAADKALYKAKKRGKNQLCFFEEK